MSPLSVFLIFIVSITSLVIAYLTKRFQDENIFYLNNNQTKNANTLSKKVEKEKVVAETLNGRFAMIGFIAATGAYLTTGQIIPGLV